MGVHRDSAPIVTNANRTIHMDCDHDVITETSHVLINLVVQNLEYRVVHPVLIRIAN